MKEEKEALLEKFDESDLNAIVDIAKEELKKDSEVITKDKLRKENRNRNENKEIPELMWKAIGDRANRRAIMGAGAAGAAGTIFGSLISPQEAEATVIGSDSITGVSSLDGGGSDVQFGDNLDLNGNLDMNNNHIDDVASIDGGGDPIDINDNLEFGGNTLEEVKFIAGRGYAISIYTDDSGGGDAERFEINEGSDVVDIDVLNADLDLNGNNIKQVDNIIGSEDIVKFDNSVIGDAVIPSFWASEGNYVGDQNDYLIRADDRFTVSDTFSYDFNSIDAIFEGGYDRAGISSNFSGDTVTVEGLGGIRPQKLILVWRSNNAAQDVKVEHYDTDTSSWSTDYDQTGLDRGRTYDTIGMSGDNVTRIRVTLGDSSGSRVEWDRMSLLSDRSWRPWLLTGGTAYGDLDLNNNQIKDPQNNTTGDSMTADPETNTEDGYIEVDIGGTNYQVPIYSP